ncbi:hypothetical protein EXIGLDRAFT_721381 [Exidia glandulosa HHB12029]|uniref:Uncharacterized protein n=1 Tax=Exidia glandulosa HHB12029 TaxID=1314781 RepID=A0A165FTF5_EXIGL|nr:hypothetical protein EXIGLDRAFT_721381 [Exidia glandulosa HHB12029]
MEGQHSDSTTTQLSILSLSHLPYPRHGPPAEGQLPSHSQQALTPAPSQVSVPSIHRSGGGTLHDEDVERIAGRLAQLVQQGNVPATAYSGSVYNEGAYDAVSSGVSYNGPAPTSPPPGAAAPQPPTAKQLYMARQQAPDAPGVNRAHGADEPPPAY